MSADKTKKVTKGELLNAVKKAMDASLAAKGARVKVEHPLFDGHTLSCRMGKAYSVQRYPSKFISLRKDDGATVWDTTAAYLSACIDIALRKGHP